MKIIRVISTSPSLAIDIHPDSALLLPGRPLFIPDWGGEWEAVVHPALRIGRLGKNISRKFAPRYCDGVTLALRLTLADAAGREGLLSAMDSSLVIGEWMDTTCADGGLDVGVASSVSGASPVTEAVAIPPLRSPADEIIAGVSAYMTLKMGDVILLPPVGPSLPVREGTRIGIHAGARTIVDLRVV